jgi:small GTP-binding protein
MIPPAPSKVVFVGATGVGKTSIITQVVSGGFEPGIRPTVGSDFKLFNCITDNRVTEFQLWDTAGQEKYRAMSRNYLQGANAAVFVFDITDLKSLGELTYYRNLLSEVTTLDDVVIGLVGNKSDLDNPAVSDEALEQSRRELGAEFALVVSAKTGQGIGDIFPMIASSPRLGGRVPGPITLNRPQEEQNEAGAPRAACC